jgi:trigger factor
VRVEVDSSAVNAALDKATTEVQRFAQIQGFRPGKAPRDRVAKMFAKDIEKEAKSKLLGEAYRDAIKQEKLNVVGYPDIEEIQFGREQGYQFAATVELAPEFELPEYKGLAVKAPSIVVTQADVDRAMVVLREQRASFNDVDRAAGKGDFLVVNYTGSCDGKPLTDLAPTAKGLTERKEFWLRLEKDSFLPGFTEQLEGMKAGDKRTATVDFPADFIEPALAGKKGVFEVEATKVKETVLPPQDDALAKVYGAENLEKLIEGVRHDLGEELKRKQSTSIRNQIVAALTGKLTCDLPESMVMEETRKVVYDIVRENQNRGVDRELIDKKKDEIYNVANLNAKERVKAAFVLMRIAEKEKISASHEELTHRIMALANQAQMRPELFVKKLRERNALAGIEEQVITGKVLDFLQLNAKVEEETAPAPAA